MIGNEMKAIWGMSVKGFLCHKPIDLLQKSGESLLTRV